MRLLLDTHVAVWVFMNNSRLESRARALVRDLANDVFVSAVNVLEVGIKHALDRPGLDAMPISARQFILMSEASNFEMLPIGAEHAARVADLPPLHRDPFDRLLIAQALTDDLLLLTHDKVVSGYGAMTLRI